MREIQLTKGYITQVDDWNYEWLNEYNWYIRHSNNKIFYAVRDIRVNGRRKVISMHNVIMKNYDNNYKRKKLIDHENHNGLDNQEHNLRPSSRRQNNANKLSCGKSKYLGVSFRYGTPRATISINNKQLHIGYFKTEEDAARVYDKKAREIHGKFANLNFKE